MGFISRDDYTSNCHNVPTDTLCSTLFLPDDIVTERTSNPTPVRNWDFIAFRRRDQFEESRRQGMGPTAEAATADLIDTELGDHEANCGCEAHATPMSSVPTDLSDARQR